MKQNVNQEVAYDVSSGDKDFDDFVFEGVHDIILQFFYTALNKADHKIRLQESLDGVNFINSKDSSGALVEITIDNSLTNDILRYTLEFNTKFARFQFIEGTAGTGTIDKLIIMTE